MKHPLSKEKAVLLKIPKWCLECNRYITSLQTSQSPFLCKYCYNQLPAINDRICLKCGGYHNAVNCRIEWAKNIVDFSAVFPYEDPVNHWISSFKYSRNIIYGRLLRNFVTNWFETSLEKLTHVDILTPVPMHFSNLNSRGFNQTSFLIARQKRLKSFDSVLKKRNRTTQLAGKSKQERQGILKNVFTVKEGIKGKNILLFDDVCTTGQTLSEISNMLNIAGANRVDCLVLCRSMRFN
ncbi:hypothetical protein KJ966_06115 [bacterium]|nr:hypothetical protein [bacterium]